MAATLKIDTVLIENPDELNFILGHAHFIQTADDLAEIAARSNVQKYGVAFCEASGGHDPENPGRMVRFEGNDERCLDLAKNNALKIAAGHSFIMFIDGAFPISILNSVKAAPTVARVIAATANPTTVLIASLDEDRKGIIGIIDGMTSTSFETKDDQKKRKDFLRMIGYKR